MEIQPQNAETIQAARNLRKIWPDFVEFSLQPTKQRCLKIRLMKPPVILKNPMEIHGIVSAYQLVDSINNHLGGP